MPGLASYRTYFLNLKITRLATWPHTVGSQPDDDCIFVWVGMLAHMFKYLAQSELLPWS